MSIANCLTKLVSAKRITQKQADDALALHDGLQGRLYPAMGPASAEAAGALEAARVMAQAAQERKLMAAKQAIRRTELAERIARHPKGKSAGLQSVLVRDNWDAGAAMGDALNIESHAESVTKRLLRYIDGAMKPYQSTMAGLRQDTESIWNVVDELFGVDSGDTTAKAAAKGFSDASTYAVDRVKKGGKPLSVLDDWRLPQMWDGARVKKFKESEFLDDIWTEFEAGNLRVMDKQGWGEAPRGAVPGIIQNAYKEITLGKSEGQGVGAFSNQLRVFRFDSPETYKRLMKKYGVGSGGLFNTMMGHIQGMAKEIAFVEVLGPRYRENFESLMQEAITDDKLRAGKVLQKLQRSITMNSPAAVRRTFDSLSGNLGIAQSELIAAIGGGMRNIQTAARLGSATIAALPGDSVTAVLASNYNGIPAAAVLARQVRDLTVNREGAEELARQLNLTAATVLDTAIGTKRFDDEVIGQGVTGRVADSLMRLSGINQWTEGLKRSFSMEFMGFLARQSDHSFDQADPLLRGFLQRYGFTAADWEKLRVAPKIEAEGARFFDVNAVDDQRLADRLMSAVIDERHFAVIEPDSRIRGAMAGGQQRGTIVGEAVRSMTQFKSFPMTFMMTHMMRSMTQGDMGNRLWRTSHLVLMMTMAGATMSQMQSLIAGRDPQDMADPQFWMQAGIRGGGFGMLGDFVYSSTTRGKEGITQFVAGPAPGAVIAAGGDLMQAIAGNKEVKGKMLSDHIKAWTPGSSLWYTKMATDRIIFDNIQAMVDPNYRTSFARYEQRMKKEFGQSFWWGPGDNLPVRAPDFSNALGQ
ncbi:MAG: hypothetical protein K0M55_15925 [Rhizobium sp.]|nr:hypothetical protein [Rhizobium sp.]MBW8447924.1 hypothetical protein [Arenimonas sp.]